MPSADPLTKAHARRLAWLVGLGVAVAIPASLAVWIAVGGLRDWEPIHTARVANVSGALLLTTAVFGPLLLRRFPRPDRLRGFVMSWFALSTFVSCTWQLPLILFNDAITGAEVTTGNLPRFISWWGYGSADTHYGTVSSYMVASEMGWLVGMGTGLTGLLLLLRGRTRPGYLLMGVGGALQAYNATYYVFQSGVVEKWDNVATDSWIGPFLYFGLGALWPAAALTASVICLRFFVPGSSPAR
ncbi:hypothetical protein [Nocardioides speluncae]|uniref:hypothetical protein n=1 Tax=Nocardioides speluncae TaxID=2670337 RepID=UPI0012B18356|nr:hypothetical protein [Nocardioides speluncae]